MSEQLTTSMHPLFSPKKNMTWVRPAALWLVCTDFLSSRFAACPPVLMHACMVCAAWFGWFALY
jgi:hypothetical protein